MWYVYQLYVQIEHCLLYMATDVSFSSKTLMRESLIVQFCFSQSPFD